MPEAAMEGGPLLEVRRLTVDYPTQRGSFLKRTELFRAVDDVSFTIKKGQTVGLVGESGSGKSSVGKALLRLAPFRCEAIAFEGSPIHQLSSSAFMPYRQKIQTIFQDPYGSLNPRLSIGAIVEEPLLAHRPELSRSARRDRVVDLLEKVGLSTDSLSRYPHQFSGGQRQRVCIARALSSQPELIICDECVSALDVSVQAQIVNLLRDLQDELGLSYLFIAHDLAIVEHVSDWVLVMQSGKIVESAAAESLYRAPNSPYTKKLLASVSLISTVRHY